MEVNSVASYFSTLSLKKHWLNPYYVPGAILKTQMLGPVMENPQPGMEYGDIIKHPNKIEGVRIGICIK